MNRKQINLFIKRQIPTLVVILLVVAALILLPSQIPMGKAAQTSVLGPRFVPTVMLSASLVFGVLSIIMEGYGFFVRGDEIEHYPDVAKKQYLKVACLVATLVIWYVLLRSVGFVIMTALLMAVSMFLLGGRKAWELIVIPAVFSSLIYWVFSNLLNVPLPAGILPL